MTRLPEQPDELDRLINQINAELDSAYLPYSFVGPSDSSNSLGDFVSNDSEYSEHYAAPSYQNNLFNEVIASPSHRLENTGLYVVPVSETNFSGAQERPVLDVDELNSLEGLDDVVPVKSYAARVFDAGKKGLRVVGNHIRTNPRKSLGVLAALAIATPFAMNKPADTRDRNMYGYPVSYTEGKGLSDDNTMEVVDNSVKGEEIVYRYVDSDGPALDLSSKNEPAFHPRTLEKITVIYKGRTEHFARGDADAPELFVAHNRVYNGALRNLVSEHYEPEKTRREYLIKRAGNLADVFDPQPKYDPEFVGPPAP